MAEAPRVGKIVTPELWETPEGWQRLKPFFFAAMEKAPGERERYIGNACNGDEELADALMRLIRANEESIGRGGGPIVDLHGFLSGSKPTFKEGELIWNRFQIVRLVGSGGMGEVYEAVDLKLGKIALKAIRSDVARDAHVIAHFNREVQLAHRLSGPHVCRIHTLYVPTDPKGPQHTFLTMEYLDGITLAEKIRESGPLPWRDVKTIAFEICEGLRVMHEAGIIHRDLKSRNIMLADRNGTVKAVVMDFGLAREVRTATAETATDVSAEQSVAGTVEYMAPEQFACDPLTPAADIFALGVVMYELATGRHPFPSGSILQAAIRRGQRPAPPSTIQKGLPHRCDEIIGRCLEFDPKKRYGSVKEVAEALKSSPVSVSRLREEIAPIPKRRLVALAILSFLVVASAAAYMIYRWTRYVPPSTEAKQWYERGLAALREGTYLQAVNAFKMAIQHDKKYLVAHARLAEAWQELDYTGPAQAEMVAASEPEQENVLPDLDRKYIEAVRITLIQDFPAAVERYKDILDNLPHDQKAYGYVDLGRAYEKTGDLKEAVQNYERAAKLAPENPAPFAHLGILKSRQMDMNGGEAAFQKADSLYQAEGNLEGRAEVAYQRGYAANVRGDSAKAKAYLETSFQIAQQIPNVQLEVRTLGQLSNAEDDVNKAIEYANQETQLARENNIEYWTTDGLNWLGTAYFSKENFPDAERSFQQAKKQAETNQHPRLKANAEFSLASIRDQEGKWDESILLAADALRYYEAFSFMTMSAQASELIVRGELGKGEGVRALKSATELLQRSRKWDDPISIEMAEESVGNVRIFLEDFPDALAHFDEALRVGRSMSANVAYQQLHCADALWRLGRYREADEMLRAIPSDVASRSDIGSGIETVRAQMFLSEERNEEARKTAQHALAEFTELPAGTIADLESVQALAEAKSRQVRQAQLDSQKLLKLAQGSSNDEMTAEAEMVQSAVDLAANLSQDARSHAETAYHYFSNGGKKESEWLSLYYIAEACKASNDPASSSLTAKKALDIVRSFEQTWSPATYHLYATRPDHHSAIYELTKLVNPGGGKA